MPENKYLENFENAIYNLRLPVSSGLAPVAEALALGWQHNMPVWFATIESKGQQLFVQARKDTSKPGWFIPIFTQNALVHASPNASLRNMPIQELWVQLIHHTNFEGFLVNPPAMNFEVSVPMMEDVIRHTPRSTITIVQASVLDVRCQVIVNAANSALIGGGGVDGAIHEAAGPGLDKACLELGGCPAGQARWTPAFDIDYAHGIIHTVGPVYSGSEQDAKTLASCYENSLELCARKGWLDIAFPMISTGVYGYPLDEAAQVSFDAVSTWLAKHPSDVMNVYLCCYRKEEYEAYMKIAGTQAHLAA